MIICYADPPYPGQARKHYRNDPSGIQAEEVDHAALIARLCLEYPEGWALSTSSPALRQVLPLCPPDVRIGVWYKPYAVYKPGVNPAYVWEPVIWRGGRRKRSRKEPTARDHISANIIQRGGTHGAKPPEFCYWLFTLLGMRPGDTLVDLFPGSGGVSRAWAQYQQSMWHESSPARHKQGRLLTLEEPRA